MVSSRAYVASDDKGSSEVGGFKAGQSWCAGLAWQAGDLTAIIGGGNFARNTGLDALIEEFTTIEIGGTVFSGHLYGHLENLSVANGFLSNIEMSKRVIPATANLLSFAGQSNATGLFDSQTDSKNDGEKLGITAMNQIITDELNYMSNGATAGTSILYYEGTSGADNWWYDLDTEELGTPFLRWIETANSIKHTNVRAIVDISGESDAGNATQEQYKTGQLAKFEIMRGILGEIPVILVPIGRNTSANFAGYQQIREWQAELADENAWIHLSPERADLALSDHIHLTSAANGILGRRVARKALQVAGETVTGAVNGAVIGTPSRSGTSVTVPIVHSEGTNITPHTGIEGFVFFDDAAEITITSAVRTNSTTITLTLDSEPTGVETLYYGYRSLAAVNVANLVKDNSAETLPLQFGKWVL
jgi:hypothetical protein